jgi:hypothetical protein
MVEIQHQLNSLYNNGIRYVAEHYKGAEAAFWGEMQFVHYSIT